MSSGITTQALRRHRWSLAGPAATQVVGALVMAVMLMVSRSVDSATSLAQRRSPGLADAVEYLGIFHGNARFLSIIMVGVTMHLAMSQQMRDIALLRSVGATPAQVRWCLVRQATIVSVPATVVGVVLAVPVGALWTDVLVSHGVLPASVRVAPDPSALVSALEVLLVASLVGTMIAVLRPSRRPPARAATAATAGAPPIGRLRRTVGLVLVVGGIVLSVVLSLVSAQVADAAGIFVLLGESIGVGLLGPLVLHAVTRLLRPVAGGATGRLALDNVDAQARRLSGALIPLVLAISFAAIQNGLVATAAHAGGAPDTTDRLMTLSGTTSTALFAAVAAVNCLVTVMVGRRRDLAAMTVTGGSRRTLLRMVTFEALLVSATALVISAVVSLSTLVPIAHTAYGTWLPTLPFGQVVLGVLAVLGLVAGGTVGPATVLTAGRAVHVLGAEA